MTRERARGVRRCAVALLLAACRPADAQRMISFAEVAAAPASAADRRVAYGSAPRQFAELRLPNGRGPFPVAILIHGGCWLAQYDLAHTAPLADSLVALGVAVWSIEYRRVGDAGGGWPGTFDDVTAAARALRPLARELARTHALDLSRVVAVGHSAGGHLALWLAAQRDTTVRVRGVVALAAISDLRAYAESAGSCNAAAPRLLGGTPAEQPSRYAAASPIERPPAGVPVRLVHGDEDAIVPLAQSEAFVARAARPDVSLETVRGAGHFDLVAPWSSSWPAVRRAVIALTGVTAAGS